MNYFALIVVVCCPLLWLSVSECPTSVPRQGHIGYGDEPTISTKQTFRKDKQIFRKSELAQYLIYTRLIIMKISQSIR